MWYNILAETNRDRGVLLLSAIDNHNTLLWAKRPSCVDSRPAIRLSNDGKHKKGAFSMQKNCLYCGTLFYCKPSHYNKKSYCSRACMAEHYKTRLKGNANPNYRSASKRTCQICGQEFESYDKDSRYCSKSCAGKSERNLEQVKRIANLPKTRKSPKKGRQLVCLSCSQVFFWPNRRALCPSCSTYGKKSIRFCDVCGKNFYSVQNKKTCSVKCLSKQRSLAQQGEQSHRWQGGKTDAVRIIRNSQNYSTWRTIVFERDNYTCQLCNERGGNLTAHHIKMVSERPDLILDTSNGITLCWGCHSGIRWREADYEELFRQRINSGSG